jgi:hypothetical protein
MAGYLHSIQSMATLASEKLEIDGWKAYSFASDDADGMTLTGCVPDGEYSRGPRKGTPRYGNPIPGTKKTIVLSRSELDAFAQRKEEATGDCYNCDGTGKTWAGWSKDAGTKFRDCSRCNATGKVQP